MQHVRHIHLITGGRYHDFDLARLKILQMLGADDSVRTSCASDFRDLARLEDVDGVALYTCDLMPSEDEAARLDAFVTGGGRLFALHATNAPIVFSDGPAIRSGGVNLPGLIEPTSETTAPQYMRLLGARFLSHLAYQRFRVDVTDPDHDLTRGLADFEVEDEPYIMAMLSDTAEVLLSARYEGDAPGYVLGHWDDDAPRPQLYVKQHGQGAVLYLTLGHACGRFDMRPIVEETTPLIGPWTEPTYLEIVRRGLQWLTRARDSHAPA